MSNTAEDRSYYLTNEELQARTQLSYIRLLATGIFITSLILLALLAPLMAVASSGVAIVFATAGLIVASLVAATFAVTIVPSLIKSAFELTGRLFTAIMDKLKPAQENTVNSATVVQSMQNPVTGPEIQPTNRNVTKQKYSGPGLFGSGGGISAGNQANLEKNSDIIPSNTNRR